METPKERLNREAAESLNFLSMLCRMEADRWYRNPRNGILLEMNDGERFALIHSEVSEAFEGVRKLSLIHI